MSSNVESLLSAILTGDEKYIVVPQSRVEELLLAIYKNGGGGGGGGTAGIKYLGVIDNYKNLSTTAKKGDYYLAGTADKDKNVHVGDMLIAQKDKPAATIDNSNYRLLHTELDTDTTYTITQDSTDKHIFYFKSSTETGTGTKITIPDNDTKTTAASDEKAATKLYLVGTLTQDANGVKTYANAKVYIGTDDCLYSNGKKVAIQEDVDKKVTKTSVSSGENSTTSVINVTDAKAQMAMVASIKGKTQKVVQLINDRKTWTNGSIVDTRTQFMPMIYVRENVSTANIGWIMHEITAATGLFQSKIKATYSGGAILLKHNGASRDINIVTNEAKITSGHSYIFSCNIKSCNPTAANGLSLENVMLFDITEMGLSDSTTLEQFNAIINEYVPYGSYLWNAPVESVVSVGTNMLDESIIKTKTWTTQSTYNAYIEVPELAHKKFFAKAIQYGSNSLQTYNIAFSSDTTLPSPSDRIKYQATLKTIEYDFRTADHVYMWITTGDGNIAVNKNNIAENFHIMCSTADVPFVPYNKTTVLVPSEARSCVGYGLSITRADGTVVANEIDFENGVFHRRVASVDLGTLTWTKAGSSARYTTPPVANMRDKDSTGGDGLCSKYSVISYYPTAIATQDSLWYRGGSTNSGITITDDSYTDAASLTNALKGQILVYELQNEELINISSYIRPLPVENGGTLTLVNEHNLDVNSTIKYKKEV